MGVSRTKSFLNQSHGNPQLFQNLRIAKYKEIVQKNSEQKQFLKTWMNRVNRAELFAQKI